MCHLHILFYLKLITKLFLWFKTRTGAHARQYTNAHVYRHFTHLHAHTVVLYLQQMKNSSGKNTNKVLANNLAAM